MKKLLTLIAVLAITLFIVSSSWAAGSVAVTKHHVSQDGKVVVIKLACVGDSSDGSVPDTTIATTDVPGLRSNYYSMSYLLFEVWAVAGSPAPDAADITITDANSLTLVGGNSGNTGTSIIPASGNEQVQMDYFYGVTSALTVAVANQATASAKWTIYLVLRK